MAFLESVARITLVCANKTFIVCCTEEEKKVFLTIYDALDAKFLSKITIDGQPASIAITPTTNCLYYQNNTGWINMVTLKEKGVVESIGTFKLGSFGSKLGAWPPHLTVRVSSTHIAVKARDCIAIYKEDDTFVNEIKIKTRIRNFDVSDSHLFVVDNPCFDMGITQPQLHMYDFKGALITTVSCLAPTDWSLHLNIQCVFNKNKVFVLTGRGELKIWKLVDENKLVLEEINEQLNLHGSEQISRCEKSDILILKKYGYELHCYDYKHVEPKKTRKKRRR